LVQLPQRDRPYSGGAAGVIAVRDEQDPLGCRIELVAGAEEINSGGVGQRLACYRHFDLIIGIELGKRSFGGIGSDNSVVGRKPAGEVTLQGGEDVAVVVDGQQHRLRHAGYSTPGVCAVPFGPGACMSVSSV